jgi:hypothetical protein
LKSIAAVRAKIMQTTTNKNVRKDGRPFAATTNAPRANGSAKIVWEKRISCRKRPIGPLPGRLSEVIWLVSGMDFTSEIIVGHSRWLKPP